MKILPLFALLFFLISLLAVQKPLKQSFEEAPVPVDQEPRHHTVLKNDSVLVMRVTLKEGERTLYHIHAHDRVAVELSNCSISQQNLNEPEDPSTPTRPGDLSAPAAGATPLIHRVHNFGPGTFEVLDVEFLQRPQQPSSAEAAPVAIENPSARVYRWIVAPGATSAMHTHARPYLIIAVTKMPLKMTAPDGQSSSHEVQPGDFHWIESRVTHSLTNEGTTEGQIVEVELK
jgi:quercetin dioxygenase-like cupin family protein